MRYVFVDVVQFSKGRTSDDQVVVVRALNNAVRRAIHILAIDEEDHILLPTGDGLCICLLTHDSTPDDLHLRLAVSVLQGVKEFSATRDPLPQHGFQIRIGVDEHNDCVVKDINGNVNVAGVGINRCQRIMDKARGGNINLSRKAYEVLPDAMKSHDSFRHWMFQTKHDDWLDVYTYVDTTIDGLNTELPENQLRLPNEAKSSDGLVENYSYAFMTSGFAARDILLRMEIGSESTIEFQLTQLEMDQAFVFYFHFRTDLDEQGWIGFCTAPRYGRFWTDAERTDIISSNKGPKREMSIWWLIKERWPELKGNPVEVNRLRVRGDDEKPSVVKIIVDLKKVRLLKE